MTAIQYIFTDVDGVLTDGRVLLSATGQESKSICYRDLDAMGLGRKQGLSFAFITAEKGPMAELIVKRFSPEEAVFGAKDKAAAFRELADRLGLEFSKICYIGDGYRDIGAIRLAGLGAAPADAPLKVRQAADFVTTSGGGEGVLLEIVEKLRDEEWDI